MSARYLGVDLAWGEGRAGRPARETGLCAIDEHGTVVDATWGRGIDEVVEWIMATAEPGSVIAIDAPLVVHNLAGMRECERDVGRRYGRWKVAANASNLTLGWLAGVTLRTRLEALGLVLDDGVNSVSPGTPSFFECYPYTTLVGAAEFGYDGERPRYKRPNLALPATERRAFRAAECDELLRRMRGLAGATPPLDLTSHPVTALLLDEASPLIDAAYKHREDLLDATLCAWTAALWGRFGTERCQVLGGTAEPDADGRHATIIAPAKAVQRRGSAIEAP